MPRYTSTTSLMKALNDFGDSVDEKPNRLPTRNARKPAFSLKKAVMDMEAEDQDFMVNELLQDLIKTLDKLGKIGVSEDKIKPILTRFWQAHMQEPLWQPEEESDYQEIEKSQSQDFKFERRVPYNRELAAHLTLCKSLSNAEHQRWRDTGKLPSDIDLVNPKERYGWNNPAAIKMQQMLASSGTSILALQHLLRHR